MLLPFFFTALNWPPPSEQKRPNTYLAFVFSLLVTRQQSHFSKNNIWPTNGLFYLLYSLSVFLFSFLDNFKDYTAAVITVDCFVILVSFEIWIVIATSKLPTRKNYRKLRSVLHAYTGRNCSLRLQNESMIMHLYYMSYWKHQPNILMLWSLPTVN